MEPFCYYFCHKESNATYVNVNMLMICTRPRKCGGILVNLLKQKLVFQDHRGNFCEEQRSVSEEGRNDTLGHLQVATVEISMRGRGKKNTIQTFKFNSPIMENATFNDIFQEMQLLIKQCYDTNKQNYIQL